MDVLVLSKLFAVLALVAGNAFFVGAEIAITSARRSRIQQLAEEGSHAAAMVQLLHSEPERFYSVTQVGITLMSLALGAIGIVTVTEVLQPPFLFLLEQLALVVPLHGVPAIANTAAHIVAFVFISAIHIVGGELAPKVYAFHKADSLSLLVAGPVNFLFRAFYFAIWFLNHASNLLLRLFGQKDLVGPGGGHFSISEEELRMIVSASETSGVLSTNESAMIHGIFELGDRKAIDVMVPRTNVIGMPSSTTIRELLANFREQRHHRYPIFDGTIDNIVGVLPIKELLHRMDPDTLSANLDLPVSEIMLPAFMVPGHMPLDALLAEFKSRHQQMSIVIDEFGGTAGVVTLEDVLEEIVGDYSDEFSPGGTHLDEQGSEGTMMINPSISLVDLKSLVQFAIPPGQYSTLSGYIYHELGRVPEIGDSVESPDCKVVVEAMDGHRITQVSIKLTQPPADPAATTPES